MSSDESHRRYLITVGITTDLSESAPRIVESVNRITQVFTNRFGYERVTTLDINPALEQIRKEIREFCLKCEPDDVVALYYTGHADEVNDKHRVWAGDTIDGILGTLETGHIAELMLVGTPLQYALIILDTCFAGKGGAEALRTSVASMGDGTGKTLALLTAAYPREQIVAGDFVLLFEHAVEQRAVAGHEPPFLTLGAIARLIDADPSRPGWQTISHSILFGRTDQLPYFPNRRFNLRLHGLDLLTQLRIEQQELRIGDLRGHFLPRARGVDVPAEPGWRFVGRAAALRDLVSWLRKTDDLSIRVVTGGPGSGKSAVIGRLVVLSDHDWRRTVPTEDLAADTIPPEDAIAVGIHARGMTSAQVLAAICAAVGVRADTPADMLREMRGRTSTVAIDAIDEALDPPGLISGVLRPLAEAGPPEGLRLLLGTRPHLAKSLGPTGPPVDLDDEHYADPASLYEYVLRGLEPDSPQSPYHSAPAGAIAAIAKAVADAAGHSFLVALIVSRTLRGSRELPDPDDHEWRASLPGNAAAAMHQDLETRLGPDADHARDLLRPLAFAHGAGLPWEDLWAALSSRLGGHGYTDDDLIWLRRQAGSYVVEAMESGQSVYRLYHAALAEYLRQGCDAGQVHQLFYVFLKGRVPASRSGPDWSRAHPYTLAHLATHAQRAGTLDELLLDPRYLVNAIPAGLLAALPAARAREAELAASAYQRAVHQFRGQPEEYRFSYLELASRITHADELSTRIGEAAPVRRWSVPWTHWPPEHPHRILDGHLGLVNSVICVDPGDGNTVVASVGEDAKLRLWDAVTAEPRGAYIVGTAPLVAARAVPIRGHRTVILLLATDGMLHTWDMSTAELLRSVRVVPRWRQLARLRNANLVLRSLGTPDGQQFAITGGRGIRTSVWDVPSGRRIAVLPSQASPEAIEFTELVDGRTVIQASVGGTGYWVYDLRAERVLPARSHQNGMGRSADVTYYRHPGGGPPLAAVRFSRRAATIWDLTASSPLGTWPRGSPAQVRLTDGRAVWVPLPERQVSKADTREDAPDTLVPLRAPVRVRGQADRESQAALSLRFETRGRFLIVEFRDQREEPDRGSLVLTLAAHTADVTGYDWALLPDGHVIVVSASRDGTVRRWDISSIRPEIAEEDDQARVALHRVVCVPLADGTPLGLTFADSSDVALWDLRTGELVGRLDEASVPPAAIAVARTRQGAPVAVTFNVDQTMRIWDLPSGTEAAQFPADRLRWPSDVALVHFTDGALIAVTTGHGRRVVLWDLATGRIRAVLIGHKGRSACVACTEGPNGPMALTAGEDNRVNVWDLSRARRRARFRIVPPWRFLKRPLAGRAHAIQAMRLDSGNILALVATSDGTVRSVMPRRFLPGARRTGSVSGNTMQAMTLSTGRTVVVTATEDGIVRIWALETFICRTSDTALLFEIRIEVPVSDISTVGNDTFTLATPNGLTAIRLDASALERYATRQ